MRKWKRGTRTRRSRTREDYKKERNEYRDICERGEKKIKD